MNTPPSVDTTWRHHKGEIYKVLLITNLDSTSVDYVPTVVYVHIITGKIWSRPLSDWERSFTLV